MSTQQPEPGQYPQQPGPYSPSPGGQYPQQPGQFEPGPQPAKRPWYKKKRFAIPLGTLALLTVIGLINPSEPETDTAAAPVATASEEPTVEATAPAEASIEPSGPSAEEIAAQEEAERVAAEQKAAEEAAAAEAERVAAEQAAAQAAAAEAAKGTPSQQNAHESAKSYLDFSGYSRAGLLEQLTSEYGEQFPPGDAKFAVARLEAEGGVDWNAEAAESAQSYLDFSSYSRQGLIEQLTSEYGEQFTPEQAEFGVSQTGL